MLQLSVYVLTVIQLTSSQSTYDVIQQENDVNSCRQTETDQILSVLSQLITSVSQIRQNDVNSSSRTDQLLNQLMTSVTQLQTSMSQLMTANSQLQRNVTELKAAVDRVHGLQTGKQSRFVTSHPVQLSLAILQCVGAISKGESW